MGHKQQKKPKLQYKQKKTDGRHSYSRKLLVRVEEHWVAKIRETHVVPFDLLIIFYTC